MEKYTIIKLKLSGLSNRQIAKDLQMDRKTIARYWDEYVAAQEALVNGSFDSESKEELQSRITSSPKYDVSNRKPRKLIDEIKRCIDDILENEVEKKKLFGAFHKQALNSKQIHELIIADGYDISYRVVADYIQKKKEKLREAFIRQTYEFGQRLEYDFGEVKLVINGEVRRFCLAVFSSPAASFRWAYLYDSQNKEVFMDSHVKFFEMIGGSYQEVVYDNMKHVVTKFIGRNEKELNKDLLKLALYYNYRVNVTNCFSGNEKGSVESSVKIIRKEAFTKIYKFDSIEDAKVHLEASLKKLNINSRIDEERIHLLPYRVPYELADVVESTVNKYCCVRLDNNFYSVPDYLVGEKLTVKKYIDKYMVYKNNTFVCEHKKIDGFNEYAINIQHFLTTFMRKPGALMNSLALKQVPELKAIYTSYFTTRTKEFIRLLMENQDLSLSELLHKIQDPNVLHGNIITRNMSGDEDALTRLARSQVKEISKLYKITGGQESVN